VELLEKTVAYKLIVDPVTKRITEVQTKTYDTEKKGHVSDGSYSAPVIVVAAHAIETARLLLFSKQEAAPSGVANSSGLVGQNLMDHLVYLSWGLSPVPLYPFRGPRSSSGIESLRDGQFRKNHAAFRVDIGNEGWGWADGDPQTLVWDLLTGSNNSGLNPHKAANRFGSDLVERLNSKLTRMMRFCFLVEQEPMASNCVTLSGDTDGLGMNRPIVNYQAGPLALKGIAKAIDVTKRIFAYAGIHNHTQAHDDEDGYACVRVPDGAGSTVVNVYGAGHIMGTYRMGTDRTNGVVNADQQSFDHPNLFLLGSGTFPTVGTANPTLTIVALAFRASRAVLKQLAARG
jgi:choline dehydrogenase-like flavoprotein